MLTTSQRRIECRHLLWSDLDLEKRLWQLEEHQTKSRRAHLVPLSDLAMAILKSLPPATGPFVFAPGDTPPNANHKDKERLDKAIMKATEGDPIPAWGFHDLRRTAATGLGALGFDDLLIGRILNHAPPTLVGQVYNHHNHLPAKRTALQAWADHLVSLDAALPTEWRIPRRHPTREYYRKQQGSPEQLPPAAE
jgi:integrase